MNLDDYKKLFEKYNRKLDQKINDFRKQSKIIRETNNPADNPESDKKGIKGR